MNAERAAFAASVNGTRNEHVAFTNQLNLQLTADISGNRQGLEETIDERNQYLVDNDATSEVAVLEAFVYDLAAVQYSPSGSGVQGFQPYAQWVANDVRAQIGAHGGAEVAVFDATTQGEISTLQNALLAEQQALATENANWQASLDAITADLVQTLVQTREEIELKLSEHQSA